MTATSHVAVLHADTMLLCKQTASRGASEASQRTSSPARPRQRSAESEVAPLTLLHRAYDPKPHKPIS